MNGRQATLFVRKTTQVLAVSVGVADPCKCSIAGKPDAASEYDLPGPRRCLGRLALKPWLLQAGSEAVHSGPTGFAAAGSKPQGGGVMSLATRVDTVVVMEMQKRLGCQGDIGAIVGG